MPQQGDRHMSRSDHSPCSALPLLGMLFALCSSNTQSQKSISTTVLKHVAISHTPSWSLWCLGVHSTAPTAPRLWTRDTALQSPECCSCNGICY